MSRSAAEKKSRAARGAQSQCPPAKPRLPFFLISPRGIGTVAYQGLHAERRPKFILDRGGAKIPSSNYLAMIPLWSSCVLPSKAMLICPDIGRAIRNPIRDVGGRSRSIICWPSNQRWTTVPHHTARGRVISGLKNLPDKFRAGAADVICFAGIGKRMSLRGYRQNPLAKKFDNKARATSFGFTGVPDKAGTDKINDNLSMLCRPICRRRPS